MTNKTTVETIAIDGRTASKATWAIRAAMSFGASSHKCSTL